MRNKKKDVISLFSPLGNRTVQAESKIHILWRTRYMFICESVHTCMHLISTVSLDFLGTSNKNDHILRDGNLYYTLVYRDVHMCRRLIHAHSRGFYKQTAISYF